MKRLSNLFYFLILLSVISSSCTNTKTYSQLLDDEQLLLSAYIKNNNINVLTSFPANNKWKQNDYVKTETGMYFHLVDSGSPTDTTTLQFKNIVYPRFKQYSLSVLSDTIISNWTSIDYAYPASFIYGDYTQSCKAFHDAASYLKHNEAVAKIIVPSTIGFKTDMMSVTPYGYTIKIKFQKN